MRSFLLGLLTFAAVGCSEIPQESSVSFRAGEPVGDWKLSQTYSDAGTAADTQPEGRSDSTEQPTDSAGRDAPSQRNADSGTDNPPLDSGDGDAPAQSLSISSLTLQVTTSPVGGRYQPKNIGAVWVEDEDGKVVKTLQVWAGTRRRYLSKYLAVMGANTIDVKTSATLSRHQTHTLTWDLKDRDGTDVARGKYRVRMELTDANQTGRTHMVELDTSQGPATLTPSDAPSFGAIKLTLQ